MTRTSFLTLLIIFMLIQGCQQQSSENYENGIEMSISKIQPDHENTAPDCKDGNMLSREEAKQALLNMRLKKPRGLYGPLGLSKEAEEYEKIYNELYEKFTESEYQYAHDYTDYNVVEITYMRYGRDIVEKWECDLKEGLCRLGDRNNIDKCGRFRKNKNGEWIATIEGGTGYW